MRHTDTDGDIAPREAVLASKLSKRAQRTVVALLDASGRNVFSRRDLSTFLRSAADDGQLPRSASGSQLISFLETQGLSRVVLHPPEGVRTPPVARYVWGPVSMLAVAASMRPGAYLSHGSAVFLHGLTDQIPKTIFVNKEQSAKPAPTQPLTQEGIDRAFANSQRASTYVFTHEGYRVVLLSGKNTNRLEVSELKGPQGEPVEATKLERTLIDITVRPAYAGGVFEVAKAYAAAKDRVSVNTIVATLKQLAYVYPYHQAVGYYLQRAGVDTAKLGRLKQLGLKFDFYLSHRMGPTAYSPEWRIRFPEGL
ncbi:MAG: hypothetical protein QM767_27370 [Anaeromyxobacter sp.]